MPWDANLRNGRFPSASLGYCFSAIVASSFISHFLNRADYELRYDTTKARCRAHNRIFAGLETSLAVPVAKFYPLKSKFRPPQALLEKTEKNKV